MSMQIFDINVRDKNNELKSEEKLLLEYFNKLVRDCRKMTKGKSYDEIENGESFDRFQNRLGYFEEKLNYTISEMEIEVTYKQHKEQLNNLYHENCLYSWDYSDNPMEDLNAYAQCLRKKVKAVIRIYEQHEFKKAQLIRGYHYYK